MFDTNFLKIIFFFSKICSQETMENHLKGSQGFALILAVLLIRLLKKTEYLCSVWFFFILSIFADRNISIQQKLFIPIEDIDLTPMYFFLAPIFYLRCFFCNFLGV